MNMTTHFHSQEFKKMWIYTSTSPQAPRRGAYANKRFRIFILSTITLKCWHFGLIYFVEGKPVGLKSSQPCVTVSVKLAHRFPRKLDRIK